MWLWSGTDTDKYTNDGNYYEIGGESGKISVRLSDNL